MSLSYIKYIVIFFILAILGLNVFTILGKTTDTIGDTIGGPIRRIISSFGFVTGETTKQVVSTTADGLDATVDVAENVVIGGIDVVQKTLTGELGKSIRPDLIDATNDLSNSIDSDDEEQSNNTLTSGFCYIGSDRGVRSCARVGDADTCMSGDIFPTQDTCVNPKLRA